MFHIQFFLTKLLTVGILFPTAVNAVVVVVVVVAKLVLLGVSPLTSFILALRVVLVAKLEISSILSSIFFILALYKFFSATSFFITSLSLLKSTGVAFIFQYLIYLLHFLNCLN